MISLHERREGGGGVVCLLAAPHIQLSVVVINGGSCLSATTSHIV